MYTIETGAGQDPARDFAGSRVRNPALFVICGILRDAGFLRDLSRKSCPAKVLKKNPACGIPQNILYFAGFLEN